ncbi:MAG: hypothetical protein KY446_12815 [Proteobacteria bacterium]|nr:hypothetical protein [Pseudomonadota bacterium]
MPSGDDRAQPPGRLRTVDAALDEVVDEAVDARVGLVIEEAGASASRADRARAEAELARDGARDAETGALEAGTAAVQAAERVAPPDDPLLDTAVRRIEARVDEEVDRFAAEAAAEGIVATAS